MDDHWYVDERRGQHLLNYIFIQLCGYQAAGYTTLVCYLVNSFMHYFFMRKVCKVYLDDLKPYNLRTLLLITGVFMGIGFLYIPTYANPILRYTYTILLLIILFTQRKRVVEALRSILKKKV